MLFFPVGETAMTTSTLFPHKLQSFAPVLAPDLAATSVFDFPAIGIPSFQNLNSYEQTHSFPVHIENAHTSLLLYPLP